MDVGKLSGFETHLGAVVHGRDTTPGEHEVHRCGEVFVAAAIASVPVIVGAEVVVVEPGDQCGGVAVEVVVAGGSLYGAEALAFFKGAMEGRFREKVNDGNARGLAVVDCSPPGVVVGVDLLYRMQLMAELGHFTKDEEVGIDRFEGIMKPEHILAAHVLHCIPAKGIHAHVNKGLVGLEEVVAQDGRSCVEVGGIACKCSVLQVFRIVKTLSKAIARVMIPVGICGIDITHSIGPLVGSEVLIVGRRELGEIGAAPDFAIVGIGRDAVIFPVGIVCGIPGLCGVGIVLDLCHVFDTKTPGMVGDHVEDDLHAAGMHSVDQVLKGCAG